MQKVFSSERIDFNKLDERLVGDYLKMVNDLENVGRLIGKTDLISEEKEVKWVRRKLEEGAPIFSMTERESGDFISFCTVYRRREAPRKGRSVFGA